MTQTELPRASVSIEHPFLPCCGAHTDEQPYCSTLDMIHLVGCSCGAVWECVAQRAGEIDLEARERGGCSGIPEVGRVWWREEEALR